MRDDDNSRGGGAASVTAKKSPNKAKKAKSPPVEAGTTGRHGSDPPGNGPLLQLNARVIAKAAVLCGIHDAEKASKLGELIIRNAWELLLNLTYESLERSEGESWENAKLEYFKEGLRSAEGFSDFISQLTEAEFSEVMFDAGLPDYEIEDDEFVSIVQQFAVFARKEFERLKLQKTKKRKTGRPKREALRSFVSSLALIFEKYSGQRFTFDRFRNSEGQYEPITLGHRFVWAVMEPMLPRFAPEDSISATAVAMECERTVKFLRGLHSHAKSTPKKSCR